MLLTRWQSQPKRKDIFPLEIQNWPIISRTPWGGTQSPSYWPTFTPADIISGILSPHLCLQIEQKVWRWKWSSMRLWLKILMPWGRKSGDWDSNWPKRDILRQREGSAIVQLSSNSLSRYSIECQLNRTISIFLLRVRCWGCCSKTSYTTRCWYKYTRSIWRLVWVLPTSKESRTLI